MFFLLKVITFPIWFPFWFVWKVVTSLIGLVVGIVTHPIAALKIILAFWLFLAVMTWVTGDRNILGSPANMLTYTWAGICLIFRDVWMTTGFFWHQSGANIVEMTSGITPENVGMKIPASIIAVFVALCQTIGWWASYGSCAHTIGVLVGGGIILWLLVPNLGNLNLGSGGGGGHAKASGGHGH